MGAHGLRLTAKSGSVKDRQRQQTTARVAEPCPPHDLDSGVRSVVTNSWIGIAHFSGRGAVWLARLNGVQEVAGSNPVAPTRRTADSTCQRFFSLTAVDLAMLIGCGEF